MKHAALAALMIAVVAGGLALAQPGPGTAAQAPTNQAPMARGMRGMQGTPRMQGMAAMMPDLTPDQLAKIDALREAHLKEVQPLRTDVQVKGIELQALWRADEPDVKKIQAEVKEIGDTREKLEAARIGLLFDIRKLLTPDQLKAMKKMGMGRGMMGKGMGRGMRGMMRGDKMGGSQSDDPPGPMMGQGGQQCCPGCNMH